MQLSKTIYFRDYPTHSGVRSGLTVSFPDNELDTFRFVENLSSYTLRQILGFEQYGQLEIAARHAESPVATFVRSIIRRNLPRSSNGEANRNRASGLQATFRGGRGSPMHDWYPYLEGYSPDFVSSIFREFAPKAKTILDPFCGSGTTALVSAMDGRNGLYAEVNPACRFIIEGKATALSLNYDERHRLADKLLELLDDLNVQLERARPDEKLRKSFGAAFGERPFFDESSFDNVLRVRTLIDELGVEDKGLAQFLTIAVLRSLVSGSLLVRRGDLRFRTASELSNTKPNLLSDIRESLHVISSDLHDSATARGKVELVSEDARLLPDSLSGIVDAIITSPPYLNGTNYFRNTKIELWFLRRLTSKAELRGFRDRAITAGINDVTLGKAKSGFDSELPKSVLSVVKKLERDAYDQRIPLMVSSYFQEMRVVIERLRAISHENTTVAIDLGDSCYGEVWVPTHDVVCELMSVAGFCRIEDVVLRERQSRDGRKLTQTLQIFEVEKTTKRFARVAPLPGKAHNPQEARFKRWSSFRDTLPHQTGEMAKRNWGHSWHSLCSYQGKLKASIAHALVDALLPAHGGRILDPFSGVGTIPFEAKLRGHTAFGFDISPAAVAISRAKLEPVVETEVQTCLVRLERWINQLRRRKLDMEALEAIRFNGPLPAYFHPRTLGEIVAARSYFQQQPPVSGSEALVFSALLHILHGNRPYALSRRSHPITPFAPTGPIEYRGLMERLSTKVSRCLADLDSVGTFLGRSYYQDATASWPSEVDKLDAIVTSPPFFDSTRFHTANWMRLWFAGWEPKDFSTKPSSFVDERQKKTFDIYESIFVQSVERLKRGGYLAIHLGKSAKCDMAAALSAVGNRYLPLVDSFAENVEHCESHGIRDKGTVTDHQYLLFRKP